MEKHQKFTMKDTIYSVVAIFAALVFFFPIYWAALHVAAQSDRHVHG